MQHNRWLLSNFSWSRRDFWQDAKNTKRQDSRFWTASAGPAGIFGRMTKTQKRRERFWTALAGPAGIFGRMPKTQKRRERFWTALAGPAGIFGRMTKTQNGRTAGFGQLQLVPQGFLAG